MSTPAPTSKKSATYRLLLKWSRTLHTYLSMLAVVLFFFFGATGFMLNHPHWFGVETTVTTESQTTVPQAIVEQQDKLMLVEHLRSTGVTGMVQPFDWPGEGEVFHLAFKSPSSQTDVDIDLTTRDALISTESHGLAGVVSRLHTAREAGPAWQLILDATSILLVLASLTGIVLWQSLPKRRTLGVVALGVSIAGVLAVYATLVP
jgi:uncharacterized protein